MDPVQGFENIQNVLGRCGVEILQIEIENQRFFAAGFGQRDGIFLQPVQYRKVKVPYILGT